MILVDDGIATGMTIAVAALALRELSPAEIWLCTPVAPLKLLPTLSQWGDRIIALETPESFLSVSNFYDYFSPSRNTGSFCVSKKTRNLGVDSCYLLVDS